MKTDIRDTLPVAEKKGRLWLINGRECNYVSSMNKYGENSVGSPFSSLYQGAYLLAKYRVNQTWLVGVFLPCTETSR